MIPGKVRSSGKGVKEFFTVLVFICVLFCRSVFSSDYEKPKIVKNGATYPILERDAYDELIERVERSNLSSRILALRNQIVEKMSVNVKKLQRAEKTEVRTVTPVYTLPFSIRDVNGNVIYPEGFTFNLLDYIKFPYVLVFFDATSSKELKWLRQSGYLSRWDVILIITKGNIRDAEFLTGRTVYAANDRLVDIFSVKRTPSVVYQNGNTLEVIEVGVHGK